MVSDQGAAIKNVAKLVRISYNLLYILSYEKNDFFILLGQALSHRENVPFSYQFKLSFHI